MNDSNVCVFVMRFTLRESKIDRFYIDVKSGEQSFWTIYKWQSIGRWWKNEANNKCKSMK